MGNACVKKNCTAISTINEKGVINVNGFREENNYESVSLPFFRGITYFLFGMFLLLRNIFYVFTLNYFTESKKATKTLLYMIFSIFLGLLIGFVGFVLVPYFCLSALAREGWSYGLLCFVSACIRIAVLTIILLIIKLFPTARQFYRHNASANLAVKDSFGVRTENYHLSTNFLSYALTCFYILFFVLSFTALNINYGYKILINISISLAVFGTVYELLKLLEKNNGVLNNIFVMPISFLVTAKPSLTEKNIAYSVMEEAKMMEENSERIIDELSGKEMPMSVVISEVKEKLKKAGIEASCESEWLIAECLGTNRNDIRLRTTVSKEEYKKINNATAKREKHIPLTKIFNKACFYGLDFYVDKNVLSPRPETELLVEEAIKIINSLNSKKTKVLDLCTGSGIIATIIAKNTDAKVFASDVSTSALSVAKKNAEAHGAKVKFIESDLFKNIKKEKFDIIISNPPYIPSKDILALEDEVKKNDPLISLDGGEDGLYFYREIIKAAPDYLNKNGYIMLEIGINQSKSVKKLLQNNFENIRIKKDYNKIDRIIISNLKGK